MHLLVSFKYKLLLSVEHCKDVDILAGVTCMFPLKKGDSHKNVEKNIKDVTAKYLIKINETK